MAHDCSKLSAVAVYCGSQKGKRPEYEQHAIELAQYLALCNIGIVYGGGRCGLMGAIADTTIENGGRLTAIIPNIFAVMPEHQTIGEEFIVKDMHTRKKMIFDKSDAFIALPGGLGTMEELTEMLTWSKMKLHSRPVALLNTCGYYDHFLEWLKKALEDGFISAKNIEDILVVEERPKSLVDKLRTIYQKNK